LSPVTAGFENKTSADEVLSAMRIPVRYLANLLSAGDEQPVRRSLKRLMAVRAYMRSIRLDKTPDPTILEKSGLDAAGAHEMYELLAIAKHGDRFVVPTTKTPEGEDLLTIQGEKGFAE
jgi:nitrate reductase beta subunit